MQNATGMWDEIVDSGLFPLTTMQECKKPNRKEASAEPMVVLNAKTIFQNAHRRKGAVFASQAHTQGKSPGRNCKCIRCCASADG
jgi:hypothetical protein